jgi:pyochelin biosynthesis protein PchG
VKPRVLVAGTKFGQVYLQAFRQPDFPFELAGILAHGSARSLACARHYGVPLYTDIDTLPGDIELACVVIRGGLLGGRGGDVARALMSRGIHVLQEHPLHHDELAECLRTAARAGVVYHLNSFYVNTAPVRHFLGAAAELLRRQPARYVDAACGFQVAYSLLDILGQTLGGVRPWALEPAPIAASDTARDVPFRSLDGVIAGVPVTLRIQNQMDPADPDNYAHLLHRVTLGTEAGNLTLVATHGPTCWSPRPDFPKQVQDAATGTPHFADGDDSGDGVRDDHLNVPSVTILGPTEAPSYRRVFDTVWPAGVGYALSRLYAAARAGEKPLRRGQYHLTLCQLWQDITAQLGPPELVTSQPPRPFAPTDVDALAVAAAKAVS